MKSSFALLSVALANASDESCSGGTCAQDESTLLQIQSLRHKFGTTKTLLPGEEDYIGCFVDDNSRDMGSMLGAYNNDEFNTFALCQAACGDSLYMSLQWGGECFCADAYGTDDQYIQVEDSECSGRDIEPCFSNSHNCGGSWRQAIYAIPANLWPRVMLGDRAKCNTNENLAYVDSQQACQSLANANGHAFYSFRHNANDQGHKCFSSERCDDDSGLLYGGRTNEWYVYAKSEDGSSCTGTYEAEDATMDGGQVDSNHEGFTGSGFVNYLANDDEHIEWTLPSCNGGAVTLAFRYALSSGDRPLQVMLNGEEVTGALSTPATGAWTTYGRATLTVTLAEGANTVRLVVAGASGANVDSLIVLDGVPSYTIAPYGDAACPSGKDVTTADECRDAHTALGMEISPEWNGAHNSIPSACSTREYNWGGQHHFHFDTKDIGAGVARSDLAPVCLV